MLEATDVSNVIEFPVRREYDERDSLEHDIVLALATADDLAAGMDSVVERIHRDSGAARVEWWVTDDDGALELVTSVGIGRGARDELPLGRAGVLVLHGGQLDPRIVSALMAVTPIVRRRAAEERLERTAIGLARRNVALEDFAALVAHELKTPLQAALVADDPSSPLEDALDLVETLLEAAQNESAELTFASVAESLEQAVEDLHVEVEITADLASTLPLPPGSLRVILRNLLSNAVAAGARHVHVAAARSPRTWRLLLDDDGVGLAETDRYAAGSGLGFSLCRRIAARFGGALDLAPGPSGGTRATLEFAEAAR
jgi:signal transduction histidine kinase